VGRRSPDGCRPNRERKPIEKRGRFFCLAWEKRKRVNRCKRARSTGEKRGLHTKTTVLGLPAPIGKKVSGVEKPSYAGISRGGGEGIDLHKGKKRERKHGQKKAFSN